jgi:hypothetical protein
MSRELIARAREALDGTTPGPWQAGEHRWPDQIGCCPLVGRPFSAHHKMRNVAAANSRADIHFISDARDLVPDLAAALESALDEIDQMNRATYIGADGERVQP